MKNEIIDVEWQPVETVDKKQEKQDKPDRAEWENNRTVANLLMGSMAFFAWAVSLAFFAQVVIPAL